MEIDFKIKIKYFWTIYSEYNAEICNNLRIKTSYIKKNYLQWSLLFLFEDRESENNEKNASFKYLAWQDDRKIYLVK